MKDVKIGKFTISRDLLLFLIANALLGVTLAIESTSFTNRLYEDLGFTITQRGALEFPRELPGLLVVFIIAALSFLGDVRTSGFANIFGGIGLIAFGLVPSGFWPVVVTMMIFSMGSHMYMPLQGSIAMTFAGKGNLGRRLGEIQAVNTIALVLTTATLFILFRFANISLSSVFVVGGVAMMLAGAVFFFMSPGHTTRGRKPKLIYRKKFILFYLLSIFFGARRQITFLFVAWLIVQGFGQPVATMALLFFIMSVISIFFRPILGIFIDRMGERFVLVFEGALLLLSCLGFAFAGTLFEHSTALIIVGVCFVIDNLFSIGAGMARTTYVRRLADDPEEISGTLAFSISLDHIFTMTLPFFGTILWEGTDYRYVFLVGALISAACMFLANKIRVPESASSQK